MHFTFLFLQVFSLNILSGHVWITTHPKLKVYFYVLNIEEITMPIFSMIKY